LSLFCRHNRFVAECPICSKGTVLDPDRRSARSTTPSRRGAGSRGRGATAAAAPAVTGPYGVAGPYSGDDGGYEVRLERVPGGLRLAAWAAGAIQRRAPVLAAADVGALLASAAERGAVGDDAGALLRAAAAEPTGPGAAPPAAAASAQGDVSGESVVGRSPGRAGELRDELRVEPLEEGRVRIARWVLRPGRGWELQEAPVMLPAARFAEALAGAALPAAPGSGQSRP
jgi:hypothetical protein